MADNGPGLVSVTNLIAAVGALGTAACGLVDTTKAFGGGLSQCGFGYIRDAVSPFLSESGVLGKQDVLGTLRANWINGVSKADQKATAKSLIRVGLTADNAAAIAKAAGVDAEKLTKTATSIRSGGQLAPVDLNVLGEFDVIVSAALDRGYERADQSYRNWAKLAATAVAVVLAAFGGFLIFSTSQSGANPWHYFGSSLFGLSLLVGLLATPIAPITKDLTSALAAAVGAVGAARRSS
jgi:hypothetical protein